MMRRNIALLTAVALNVIPFIAAAQECPPGGWFCEGREAGEGEDPAGGADADPDVDVDAGEVDASKVELPEEEESEGPKVVVITKDADEPKVVVVGEETEPPPPPEPAHRPFSEWGFNLRIEGVLLGENEYRVSDAGMGGLGFSFRYRPVPNFAFDVGVDFLAGRDWSGYERVERALLFNGIVFFNPYDAVQVYALGGFGFAGADVDVEYDDYQGTFSEKREYSYFGGQLGGGLEFRVGKRTALNVDVLGFVRGRTDHDVDEPPEYVDPEDPTRTTDTSGGGLLRGGVTFYW